MEETKIKNDERSKNRDIKNSIIRQNDTGPRLLWVRSKLNLGVSDIYSGSGLAPSTLSDWENGVRTGFWEGLLSLSMFYDGVWKEKYFDYFPFYKGTAVKEISFNFLLFGEDKTLNELRELTLNRDKQESLYKKEIAMKNAQLDMFKERMNVK